MPPTLIVGGDGGQTLPGTAGADLIYGFDPDGAAANPSGINAVRVASAFDQPVFVGAAPDDPNRIFVVEKDGRIWIVDISQGDAGIFQTKATPFLDVSTEVNAAGERGLLGLAFDPDYAQNGFFYVNLINLSGDTEIRRYQASGNPDVANAASGQLVIKIAQPAADNHKAGWLGFGPDGMLYAALGDGGSTPAAAQDVNSLRGKILRLDVRADAFLADPDRNYAIPADNPFAGAAAGADEIWALGLRNPWRDSFDRATGQLFIADVGQAQWEEIDLGQSGANYGWNKFEGPAEFIPGSSPAGMTFPIHSYDHSVGNAIVGGYVYRGPSEQLHGQYFFGDVGAEFIATLRLVNGQWVKTDRTAQITANIAAVNNPVSFGEDARGNLYVADIANGEIFRLTPVGTSLDGADMIAAGAGDDWVFAGAGDDVIDGQGGNDRLYGMDGDDTFVSAPGSGADVAMDFAAGGAVDRVNVGAFTTIRTFGDILARATQVGANTVLDFGNGDTLMLLKVSKADLSVNDFIFGTGPPPPNDFNGDARADILWRHADGTTNVFLMNGASVIGGSNTTLQVDNTWAVQDKNDFNGDGSADILWRHANGTSNVFLMNGATVIGGSNTSLPVDNAWQVRGTGDFNGDGRADILWRHANGTANVFLMDGPTVIGGSNTSLQVDNNWSVADTGDFNGDGRADILWRHANGTANVFLMDGPTVIGGSNISLQVDNNWSVADTGDFNGDGRADILWRHANGTSNVFLMDGPTVIGGSNTSLQVDNNWSVADTGDYNGDGRTDILWRHQNGTTNVFLMDGPTVLGGGNTSLQVDNNWHVV